MKRIFTTSVMAAALVAASFNSFAQCSFSTTAPIPAPGITNTFTTTAEGFTGAAWDNASGGVLLTPNTTGVTITTPIYYLASGQTTIYVRFTLDRLASNSVTSYSVTATTNAGTITLCPTAAINISPNAPTTYYISIPRGSLSYNTNFRLNITLGQNGSFRFDNFGTNANGAQGTLPVKFSSFEAKSVNGGVNLAWNVASEENVGRYDVEKSADNRNYVNIGSVEAKGNDSYSFLDTKATSATVYYRVKAVDVDGKLTYSAVVTMKGGKSSIALKGFPMPVLTDITLQHATAAAGSLISISSAEGREVKTVVPAKGSQQTSINLASLTPGVYVIRYSTINGEVETMKIVKQ